MFSKYSVAFDVQSVPRPAKFGYVLSKSVKEHGEVGGGKGDGTGDGSSGGVGGGGQGGVPQYSCISFTKQSPSFKKDPAYSSIQPPHNWGKPRTDIHCSFIISKHLSGITPSTNPLLIIVLKNHPIRKAIMTISISSTPNFIYI